MRRTALVLTLIVACLTAASAQESKKYLRLKKQFKYRESYVIDNNSEKIYGLIKTGVMNDAQLYSYIMFITKDGKKRYYSPSQIKGFGYSAYTFVSDQSMFYQRVRKNKKLSLYKRMTNNTMVTGPGPAGMTTTNSNETFYLQKEGESSFKKVPRLNFKKKMTEYLQDCEAVRLAIENGDLKYRHLMDIVYKYNLCL